MRLRLEPWSPAYDTSSFDPAGEPEKADLNLAVELDRWQPVQTGRSSADFERVLFVDGTRRLEAKVFEEWEEDGVRHTAPCLMGAYAVGLAELRPHRTAPGAACKIIDARLRRVLILGAGRTGEPLRIGATSSRLGELVYANETVLEGHNKDNALEQRLQGLMRRAESEMASGVKLEDDLLVIDGPLPVEKSTGTLGYVKTLHNLMVGPLEQRTLFALQRGQRTPVFLVGGRLGRYSWFLRLENAPGWHQGLAGIVRLEVHEDNGPEWAKAVADWTCLHLPKLAARGFRDPRAPQQLMPVAFLENELGRRMGDAQIVRRRIQNHLRERFGSDDEMEPTGTDDTEPVGLPFPTVAGGLKGEGKRELN